VTDATRQAVVLAGGLGTRLRPYTISLPKPLIPVGNHPVAEYVLTALVRAGVEEIVFAVNHQANVIQAYFGDGHSWGVSVRYHVEPEPRGTMGCLADIPSLESRFLVVNGDVLSDVDLASFSTQFASDGSALGVVAIPRTVTSEYGEITLASPSRAASFVEKPQRKDLISGGIYAMDRGALEVIHEREFVGADVVIQRLLGGGRSVFVYTHTGLWLDLGRPVDFDVANELADQGALDALCPQSHFPGGSLDGPPSS